MGRPTIKPCRLCGLIRPLRNSHIFPKFYWDWLKETGSGYFRKTDSPNVKRQDGRKIPLMCHDCEQLFSVWESDTARKVFVPLMSDSALRVEYEGWFYRFLISVLWRNLTVDLTERQHMLPRGFEPVETAWRLFLLGKQPLTEYSRIHVFVTDLLPPDSPMSSVYMARDADFSVVTKGDRPSGVFAKFAKLILWAEIKLGNPEEWVNTLVNDGAGVLTSGSQELRDRYFGSFLIERSAMRKASKKKLFAEMSAMQRVKLDRWKQQNAERMAQSKLFEAMLADVPTIEPMRLLIPKVGRNQLCPCGSGKKYKKCHGR